MDVARGLRVSGLELTMGSADETLRFRIGSESAAWVRGLDFVSIHAPAFSSCPQELIPRIHHKLVRVYRQVNARALVLHPNDIQEAASLIAQGLTVAAENLAPLSGFPRRDLLALLDRYPDLCLCLDLAHAFLWPDPEIGILVQEYGKRITHVHVSGVSEGRDHRPLAGSPPELLGWIRSLNSLGFPLVLEEEIGEANPDLLHRELSFLADLLDPEARPPALPD